MEYESTVKDTFGNVEHQDTIPTFTLMEAASGNGASTAQAGYGLFWGGQHPWNCSYPLPQESAVTNNKAELAAAIKALQVARDHYLEQLIFTLTVTM